MSHGYKSSDDKGPCYVLFVTVFQGDTVTIAISHVSLEEGSSALSNENIKQLFVEYKFLTIDAQETETPFSLPKPKPYHQIQFNFSKSKVIHSLFSISNGRWAGVYVCVCGGGGGGGGEGGGGGGGREGSCS